MPIPSPQRQRRRAVAWGARCILAAILLASGASRGVPRGTAQGPPSPQPIHSPRQQSPSAPAEINPTPLTAKQQRAMLKSNYTKMKQDADELAGLAKSLQEDLDKSNADVLSLTIVEKADKIEKLAKKIKSSALQ